MAVPPRLGALRRDRGDDPRGRVIERLAHPPGQTAGAPRLVLLMATIGIAQLLSFLVLVFAELLPEVPPGGDFPTLVPRDWTWQVTDDLLVGAARSAC